jgi:hypothetical protein
MTLTRDQFLAAADKVKRPTRSVAIPALGGDVIIQGLTVGERTAFEQSCLDKKGKFSPRQMRERLIGECLVQEDGSKILADGDLGILTRLPAGVIEPLFDAARELAGMTDADVKELGND